MASAAVPWEDIPPPQYDGGVEGTVPHAAPLAPVPKPVRAPDPLGGQLVRLAAWRGSLGHWDPAHGRFLREGTREPETVPADAADQPTDLLPCGLHALVPPAGLSVPALSAEDVAVYYNLRASAAALIVLAAGDGDRALVEAALGPDAALLLQPCAPPGWKLCPEARAAVVGLPPTRLVFLWFGGGGGGGGCIGWEAYRVAARCPALQLFPLMADTEPDSTPAPKTRVQTTTLRALTRSVAELARHVDAAATAATAAGGSSSSATAAPLLSWEGLLYDSTMDVPRASLNWAAFGVWFVRPALSLRPDPAVVAAARAQLDTVTPQPLASYGKLALAVQDARVADAPLSMDVVERELAYGCAVRPTAAQVTHLLHLHYWASEHGDVTTAVCPPGLARKAIETYLMLGLVATRKRAYRFHDDGGTGGRQKRKA